MMRKEFFMAGKITKTLALLLAAVMVFSLFTGCKDDKMGPVATAEPSNTDEPSNLNDAPATTTFIAKVDGKEVWSNVFNYFIYDSLAKVDFSGLEIPEDATDAQILKLRLDYLKTENENGVSRYQQVLDDTFDYCQKFTLSIILANEAGFDHTEEEIEKYNSSVDQTADNLLLYYGDSEGVSTRDEIVYAAVGMNVNDYKRFYLDQLSVTAWTENLMTNTFSPTDDQLTKYYTEHEANYRTVTVRKLFVPYAATDENGVALPEETVAANKQAALEKAEKYRSVIIDNDLDMGSFSVGFSSETETTNRGLLDLSAMSTVDPALIEWAVAQEAASSDIAIVESANGYYLVRCEGITTYYEDSPVTLSTTLSSTSVQSSVLEACKSVMYDEYVTEQTKLDRFALTDVDNDMARSLLDAYIAKAYESSEEAEETPEPEA